MKHIATKSLGAFRGACVKERPYTFGYTCAACSAAQSCPTLCNFMNGSPPGSSVHGITQQEYCNGWPFPSPEDLPDPGIEPTSSMAPALTGGFLPTHSIILVWRSLWAEKPGSTGLQRVGQDWSDLVCMHIMNTYIYLYFIFSHSIYQNNFPCQSLAFMIWAFQDWIFSFWVSVLYLPWGRVFEPCNYWYFHLGVGNSLLRWTVLCITKCLLRGKTAPPFESHCPNKTPTLVTYIISFFPL